MKVKKLWLVVSILSFALVIVGGLAFFQPKQEKFTSFEPDYALDGCTVIIVGKDASVDGSVMTTHTCDCGHCDWTWRYVPAVEHEPGTKRRIYYIDQYKTWPPSEGLKWDIYQKDSFTEVEIPQPSRTNAYLHGMFGYMNEHQLAIGESTIGGRREMRNPTPSATFDITALTMIAMEQCKTAREAIKLMGSLGEKHGYGHTDSGEMLAIADPDEAWIFEIMPVGPLWTPKSGKPGAIWCAQRVPDDHVSVCPNASRIGEIDLNNPDYFMASPNVITYAVDKGYYDPKSGKPFNWKKTYLPEEGSAKSTRGWLARLWRFFDLVAPSQKFSSDIQLQDLPFSVKPDKKLPAADVIELTRDKFHDSMFDLRYTVQAGPFSNPNYLTRPYDFEEKRYNTKRFISDNRAEYVTVTQSRSWLPDPIGGIVWLAFGAQDTSCFMPLYAGINQIPRSFEIGDHWEFDRESARWAFDYVDFHTNVAYSLAIEDVRKVQEKWEGAAMNKVSTIDKIAEDLYKSDPAQAIEFLTDYCMNNASSVVDAWWELGDQLLVKYNKVFIYDTETREQITIKYPEWWLKKIIEYDKLKPQEQKH